MRRITIILLISLSFLSYLLTVCIDKTPIMARDTAYIKHLIGIPIDTIIVTPPTNGKTYILDAQTVGIVEGFISDDTALANVKAWNNMINNLPNDITTLQIDKLDAYFHVEDFDKWRAAKYNTLKALKLRSNLHLRMSNDVYLRVQPNTSFSFHLLSIFESNNITVTGGHLVGDRFKHDYSPVTDRFGNSRNSHEWGYLLNVTSSKNIIIEGVDISDSSGDCININASHIRNQNGTPGQAIISEDILIKNCQITRARRNGISVVDGNRIEILENTFKENGLGEQLEGSSASGIAPRSALDLEAYNENNANGDILQYEKVENITVKKNRFIDNHSDFILFICYDVLVEENEFSKGISCQYSANVEIKKNILIGMTDSDGEAPKSGISTSSSRRVKNISIHHNTIKNYKNGMPLNGANIKAYANILEDFKTGLVLGKLEDSEIYGNTYNASNSGASGIRSVNGYAVGNVKIHKEVFNVTHRPLNFINYNQGADGLLTVEDCIFNSTGFELYLNNSKNINFKNITSNRDFQLVDCINVNY